MFGVVRGWVLMSCELLGVAMLPWFGEIGRLRQRSPDDGPIYIIDLKAREGQEQAGADRWTGSSQLGKVRPHM